MNDPNWIIVVSKDSRQSQTPIIVLLASWHFVLCCNNFPHTILTHYSAFLNIEHTVTKTSDEFIWHQREPTITVVLTERVSPSHTAAQLIFFLSHLCSILFEYSITTCCCIQLLTILQVSLFLPEWKCWWRINKSIRGQSWCEVSTLFTKGQ